MYYQNRGRGGFGRGRGGGFRPYYAKNSANPRFAEREVEAVVKAEEQLLEREHAVKPSFKTEVAEVRSTKTGEKKKEVVVVEEKKGGGKTGSKKKNKKKTKKEPAIRSTHLPTWGPENPYSNNDTTGDESISQMYALNSVSLQAICMAIVSTGLTMGGDSLDSVNHQYIARFLFDYLIDEATGVYHIHPLKYAPAVYWDILHAATPRSKGNHSYAIDDTNKPTWVETNTSNCGQPLGGIGNDDQGWATIDVSMASYTSTAGFTATNAFFRDMGQKLDCVEDTYRLIESDDPSIFVGRNPNTPRNGDLWVRLGATFFATESDIHTFQKCDAPWLARLGLLASTAAIVGRHVLKCYSAPSSMVSHRIMKKLRGYAKANQQPLLKAIDAYQIVQGAETLFNRVATVAPGTYPANSPFLNVNSPVTFIEFAYMMNMAILRHQSRWGGVTTCCCIGQSSIFTYYYWASSGNVLLRNAGSIRIPQIIEENLSALYDYEQGDIHVYPQVMLTTNYTSLFPAIWTAGSGTFTRVINFLSSIIFDTAEEAAKIYNTNYNAVLTKWHNALELVQAYLPISQQMYTSNFCATQTSVYMSSFNLSMTNWGMSSTRKIGSVIREHLDHMCLPIVFIISNAAATAKQEIAGLQSLFVESYFAAPQRTVVRQQFIAAMLVTVHALGGAGDQDAEVEEDQFGYLPQGADKVMKAVKSGMDATGIDEKVALKLGLAVMGLAQ